MNIKNSNTLPWAQRYPKKFLFFFSLMTIAIYQCYSAHFLNPTVVKLLNNITILGLLVYLYKLIFTSRKSVPFYNVIRLIIFSIFLSFFSCWLMNGQSMLLTFTVASRSSICLIMFFLLYKLKPDVSTLEKYILIFAFLYILLWLYAMSQAPMPVFGFGREELDDDRGIFRINFIGRGNLIIAMFLSLNKFVNQRKKIWLALTILFFIFIVLQVTRQLIIFSFLVGIGYYFRKNIKKCILLVLACFLIFQFVTISISDDSVIGSMIRQTEQQAERQQNEDDDIRVKEYIYYFTEYNTNLVTMVLGNGMYHKTSNFGKKVVYVQQTKRYFINDVGYPAMYGMYGVLGLYFFCLFFYKGARSKIDDSLMYARLFFVFMIPANITAAWFMGADYSIILAICAYLFVYDSLNKTIDNKNQIGLLK